ncbi:hypothetical protein EO238_27175, partial [Citrobacter sp. AAK_AS5]
METGPDHLPRTSRPRDVEDQRVKGGSQRPPLVEELGRAAQLKVAQGVPANVIPMALWHTASLGLDVWLSAIAFGASQIVVLATE